MEAGLSRVWGLFDTRSTLVGLVVFVAVFWFIRRRTRKLPPGPTGWPILGYIPQLATAGEDPHVVFSKLSARYGDVISVNIAGNLTVILHGYNTIKEALNKPQFSARPRLYMDEKLNRGKGFIMSSGEVWAELRKFSLNIFKSFGVGKSSFEETIATQGRLVVDEFRNREGAPFDPRSLITSATSNIIRSVMFGERCTDERMECFQKCLTQVLDNIGTGAIIEYSAFVSKLTFLPSLKEYMRSSKQLNRQVYTMVDEHNRDYDRDNPTDYIDFFHHQIEANKSAAFNTDNLAKVVTDFFIAGTETTTTSLCWAVLYVMAYPEVQARVQAELDAATARNRLPRLSDRPDLPYTQAVLSEIQRIATVNPLSVPHCASEDTTFRGYNIPKGTVVMANLWHNHFDPTVWEEPLKFRPERFLDEDGSFVAREEFTPFGIGRRICMGDQLAKMDIFIFFTFLLHHFTIEKPQGSPPASLHGRPQGGTWSPQSFEISAVLRE